MEWLNIIDFLKTVWAAMNSPIGITVAAGIVAWLLERVFLALPAWKAYEGTIIGAIKYAEKEIPDDTENKSLARLDAAIKYVLEVYQACGERPPSPRLLSDLRETISVKHAELEAAGNLAKKGPTKRQQTRKAKGKTR